MRNIKKRLPTTKITLKPKNTNFPPITQKRHKKQKEATFTYYHPDARTIAKLFKNTSMKISFNISNTIQNI
jgi:hypothetical protein